MLNDLANPTAAMPWAEGNLAAAEKKNLGSFWKPIQKLLHRDPLQRATVQQFRLEISYCVAL